MAEIIALLESGALAGGGSGSGGEGSGGEDEEIDGSITFKTNKAIGETIYIGVSKSYEPSEIVGATLKGMDKSGSNYDYYIYTLESQTVTVKGLDCEIHLGNNGITEFDLSKIKYLSGLTCNYNELTQLDVSKISNMTYLDCSNNQLSELDVTQNTQLVRLYCENNNIKGDKMTALVKSLPDRSIKFVGGTLVVYSEESSYEKNVITKDDVAIAKAKNWNVLDSSNNKYEGI